MQTKRSKIQPVNFVHYLLNLSIFVFNYRVRQLIDSGVKFTHNQLNTEAEITKLHMAILLTLMDNIIPKFFIPASFQPCLLYTSDAADE